MKKDKHLEGLSLHPLYSEFQGAHFWPAAVLP